MAEVADFTFFEGRVVVGSPHPDHVVWLRELLLPAFAPAATRRHPVVVDVALAQAPVAGGPGREHLAWLRQVYPGSLLYWGARQWVTRLPGSMRELRPRAWRGHLARHRQSRPS